MKFGKVYRYNRYGEDSLAVGVNMHNPLAKEKDYVCLLTLKTGDIRFVKEAESHTVGDFVNDGQEMVITPFAGWPMFVFVGGEAQEWHVAIQSNKSHYVGVVFPGWKLTDDDIVGEII